MLYSMSSTFRKATGAWAGLSLPGHNGDRGLPSEQLREIHLDR